MAYNNMFPTSYQPVNYQQMQYSQQPFTQQTQQVQQPTMNSNLIWVQGEAGAKSYLVAPNTTVQLWDSEDQVIYLKSADASGMPSMKVLDYQIRQNNQSVNQPQIEVNASYATKDELTEIRGELRELKTKLESMNNRRNGGKDHGKPAVQLNAE